MSAPQRVGSVSQSGIFKGDNNFSQKDMQPFSYLAGPVAPPSNPLFSGGG